ncbi:hypothetical protein [Pikeienuella piscinae]|uniref:hypothetical protein n=1 Tax=Pikeienuella piscinae TaxID=2748098 RepID=UPI001BAA71D1|nr:hypothetical protein [Pikeienuella piscinae]
MAGLAVVAGERLDAQIRRLLRAAGKTDDRLGDLQSRRTLMIWDPSCAVTAVTVMVMVMVMVMVILQICQMSAGCAALRWRTAPNS